MLEFTLQSNKTMLAPSLESELAAIPYLAHIVGVLFVLVHFGLFTLAVKLILPRDR
jgi:hypothetical protein